MKSPIAILIVRLVVALVFVDAIVSAQSLQHATLELNSVRLPATSTVALGFAPETPLDSHA